MSFRLLLALICAFPFNATAQTAGVTPTPLGKLVDVGGYRIHLYCTGKGGPTVVIVGAGLSFDWGLVQPEVAGFSQVCTYDHSGIGWSDSGPEDSCSLRVGEVHTALKNAGVKGPYVLVGHSLGGLVARLYVARYPNEVAGMVFVDHAFSSSSRSLSRPFTGSTPGSPLPPHASPSASAGPEPPSLTLESDPNFSKLPAHDQELHLWAISLPSAQAVPEKRVMASRCLAEIDAATAENIHPLGDKPLADVSTEMGHAIPEYVRLQAALMSLSQNSKEMIAENSTHFVIIDRPDIVIDAIGQVVRAVRNKTKLQMNAPAPSPGTR